AGLVYTSGGNQLIDQALDILSAKRCQRGLGDIEEVEIIRDVQPDVAHVSVVYLEDLQVEHHFRPGTIQLPKKLGRGCERRLRPSQRDRAGASVQAGKLHLKQCPHRVQQLVQVLRRIAAWDIERAQAHAIVEAVIFRVVNRSKKNGVFQRHAEALGDRRSGHNGGSKIRILQIKAHVAAGEVVVEDHRQ